MFITFIAGYEINYIFSVTVYGLFYIVIFIFIFRVICRSGRGVKPTGQAFRLSAAEKGPLRIAVNTASDQNLFYIFSIFVSGDNSKVVFERTFGGDCVVGWGLCGRVGTVW